MLQPGHRVPRFSSMNWAFCVPNECSANEVEKAFQSKLQSIFESFPISIDIHIHQNFCQTKSSGFSYGFITVRYEICHHYTYVI